MTKRRAEADVERFKGLVEEANVEEVDVPEGRKEVEIAYEQGRDFITEEGLAVGVYHEPDRRNSQTVHIDWASGSDDEAPSGRTSVERENIVTFEESEYL